MARRFSVDNGQVVAFNTRMGQLPTPARAPPRGGGRMGRRQSEPVNLVPPALLAAQAQAQPHYDFVVWYLLCSFCVLFWTRFLQVLLLHFDTCSAVILRILINWYPPTDVFVIEVCCFKCLSS